VILAERTFRTGVQTLSEEEGRYFVAIRNRSYSSKVEIPPEKVAVWLSLLAPDSPSE